MNKAILMGRPTNTPEIRYTAENGGNQLCIAHFTLAVDRKFKRQGDDMNQTADFINCVAFGKQGEFAEKYVKKGVKIAVEGRIQTGSYTNKDGQKVYTTEVIVEGFDFCEKAQQAQPQQAEQPPAQQGFMDIPDGIEQDLPFK